MMRPLSEDGRFKRRTIADAIEVVRQMLGVSENVRGQIRIAPFALPSGECTAAVAVLFPDFSCYVSLPAAARFMACAELHLQRQTFEITDLDNAEMCLDGSVKLADGSRLRAVEVIATHLPYHPSKLDERILRHVISLTKSDHCYRSIREGMPENQQQHVPDLRVLDYARVRSIQAPPLKVIQGYIAKNDPELKVSNQKIADALAMCGVRIPRRRPRAGLKGTSPRRQAM
jgi:hypothetical protein